MTQDKQDRQHRGLVASIKGFANENRVLGLLLERGYNASKVDLPHSKFDLIIVSNGETKRLQIKTVSPSGSVSFKGGARGGVERIQISGIKEYRHSTKTVDAVVGVQSIRDNGDKIDCYFIPAILIEKLNQGSISINKIPFCRNNYELLNKCKEENYVLEVAKKYYLI